MSFWALLLAAGRSVGMRVYVGVVLLEGNRGLARERGKSCFGFRDLVRVPRITNLQRAQLPSEIYSDASTTRDWHAMKHIAESLYVTTRCWTACYIALYTSKALSVHFFSIPSCVRVWDVEPSLSPPGI